MYLAKFFVSLQPTVNDPQGQTIQGGLRQLGFDKVVGVRAGKYMEVRIAEDREGDAAQSVKEMCEKLLANPLIEDYRFELEPLEGS